MRDVLISPFKRSSKRLRVGVTEGAKTDGFWSKTNY